VEYASIQASRLVQGPYLYITSEDKYQLAQTPHGLRLEIVSDAPPPKEVALPPVPVLEMPATFNLELTPGRTVALETICDSGDLDMSRTQGGTLVDGNFWGVLKIVHKDETHSMDFNGTKLTSHIPNEFFLDQRTISKLVVATKPTIAKCTLTIVAPKEQSCELVVSLAQTWSFGMAYPMTEKQGPRKLKYFLRVRPEGYLEHFDSDIVVTSLYYEAMPDPSQGDLVSYITPSNGYAMPTAQFVPHISKILDDLGLSIGSRTSFINNAVASFGNHKNIAYRFMQPHRLSAAIELQVMVDPCVFRRIFLMWRGVTDEEMLIFVGAGEKEAAKKNWKAAIGLQEGPDMQSLRVIDTSIMECA